jgi:hypothetical protein
MDRNQMMELCINKFRLCGLHQLSSLSETIQSHIMANYMNEEQHQRESVFVTLRKGQYTGVFIVSHTFQYMYVEILLAVDDQRLVHLIDQLRGRFRTVDCIVLKGHKLSDRFHLLSGIPIVQPSDNDCLYLFRRVLPKHGPAASNIVEIPECTLEFKSADNRVTLWRHSHTQYISSSETMVYIILDPPVVYPWIIDAKTTLNTELKAPLMIDDNEKASTPHKLPKLKTLAAKYPKQHGNAYSIMLSDKEDYVVRRVIAVPKLSSHPDIVGFQDYIYRLADD